MRAGIEREETLLCYFVNPGRYHILPEIGLKMLIYTGFNP